MQGIDRSRRLHPVYRWLAGILGTAVLVVLPFMVIAERGSLLHKMGEALGGIFIGGLFLYCGITGNQYDYKPEADDE